MRAVTRFAVAALTAASIGAQAPTRLPESAERAYNSVKDRVDEVLDRVERLSVLTDQQAQDRTGAGRRDRLAVFGHVHARLDAEPSRDPSDDLSYVGRKLAVRRDTSLGCYEIGKEQSMCFDAIQGFSFVLKNRQCPIRKR